VFFLQSVPGLGVKGQSTTPRFLAQNIEGLAVKWQSICLQVFSRKVFRGLQLGGKVPVPHAGKGSVSVWIHGFGGGSTLLAVPGRGGLWDGGDGLAVGVVEEAEGFAAEGGGAAAVIVGEEVVAGGGGDGFHGWGLRVILGARG